MTSDLIKRGGLGHTVTDTDRENDHVKTEAEIGMMQLQTNNQDCWQPPASEARRDSS